MSFAGAFRAIAARYGQEVALYRDGTLLGTGRAVLRPILDRERQYLPTDLGVRRQEQMLCLGEDTLPFAPARGETVLRQGEDAYDVENVRPVQAGDQVIYWRAVLTRRDREEA